MQFEYENFYYYFRIKISYLYYSQVKQKQNLMSSDIRKSEMQQMVRQTVNKQGSWGKHVSHSCCKCEKCNCGKHKCQIRAPHLQARTHNSTYQKQYQKKKILSKSTAKKEKSFQAYHPRQIISKSMYKNEFKDKIKQSSIPPKQIYKDNIQIGGPSFSQTTYQNTYTPFHGSPSPSQKIVNPQNLGISPGTRMLTMSNYRDTYKWHPKDKIRKQKPIIQQNNLKIEINPFSAQSSYSAYFQSFPNYKRDKSNFAPDRRYHSTKGIYTQTSYHDHYREKKIQKCPAQNCC